MPLTSVVAVKKVLRLDTTDTKDDALLQTLVDGATAAITQAIGRNLVSADYTEVRDGTGTPTLMLANYPITAVNSVAITYPLSAADAPANSTPLIEGVDFGFTTTAIKLLCGIFPRGVQNVTVDYTAGYASAPADIAMAATKYAVLRYQELQRLGQKSKTIAGETISFDLSEMPPDVLAICNRYQTKIPLVASLSGLTS